VFIVQYAVIVESEKCSLCTIYIELSSLGQKKPGQGMRQSYPHHPPPPSGSFKAKCEEFQTIFNVNKLEKKTFLHRLDTKYKNEYFFVVVYVHIRILPVSFFQYIASWSVFSMYIQY
jgi:hypothetical protein